MEVLLRGHGGDGGATAVLVRCYGGHGGSPLSLSIKCRMVSHSESDE